MPIREPVSLLDNKPLKQLLTRILDLQRIDCNIMRGYLSSFLVTASCYNDGDSISFFQLESAPEWRRARRCGQQTLLGIYYLMASAAIPLVFPSVRIHQHYYGDGSVNQLASLSAPIHLGADKILIIGVDDPAANIVKTAAITPSRFSDYCRSFAGYRLHRYIKLRFRANAARQ
ncbi:hypothetical protein ALON55S_02352 [Alishewanella longhuensis]